MPVLGCDLTKGMFDDECSHILCSKCIKESNTGLPETQRRCPICIRWFKESPVPRDEQVLAENERPRKRRKTAAAKDDHESYFNEEGVSTKLRALVEDVQKDLWETKRYINLEFQFYSNNEQYYLLMLDTNFVFDIETFRTG